MISIYADSRITWDTRNSRIRESITLSGRKSYAQKDFVPEESEQINGTELEPQVTEDAVEGLEQPPADAPQEDVSPPTAGEDAPPPELPPVEEQPPDSESAPLPSKNGQQSFCGLDFNALNRGLTAEEGTPYSS